MKLVWEVVGDPEPDPVIDAWLDYLAALGRVADTVAVYIGPAVGSEGPP